MWLGAVGVGLEEVLDNEFAFDLGRGLQHCVSVGFEVDLWLNAEAETLLEFAADIENGIFGAGIAKPETDFVHLRPDANDGSVDHRAALLEGLTDKTENDIKPAREVTHNDESK